MTRSAGAARRWGSLTSSLDLTSGPPRVLLDNAFSHRRAMQRRYRESVGPMLVARGTCDPGTLGVAFDAWVQLQATPRPLFDAATRGAWVAGEQFREALGQLLERLAPTPTEIADGAPGPWTGPSAALDQPELLRLCWAVASLTEVYRAGWHPGGPLDALHDRGEVDLLGLAGDDGIAELTKLTDVARERLLPAMTALANEGPTRLAPRFTGSDLMDADADLVVGAAVVELKTGQGPKAAGGGRRACLDGITLSQLLGYVLHDLDDVCRLGSVVLYQARYGHLASWPLQELLDELAGGPVDLAKMRERWRLMLLGGPEAIVLE